MDGETFTGSGLGWRRRGCEPPHIRLGNDTHGTRTLLDRQSGGGRRGSSRGRLDGKFFQPLVHCRRQAVTAVHKQDARCFVGGGSDRRPWVDPPCRELRRRRSCALTRRKGGHQHTLDSLSRWCPGQTGNGPRHQFDRRVSTHRSCDNPSKKEQVSDHGESHVAGLHHPRPHQEDGQHGAREDEADQEDGQCKGDKVDDLGEIGHGRSGVLLVNITQEFQLLRQ